MGMFKAQIGVSGNGSAPIYVNATVDTGAVYTVLTADLLKKVGVEPDTRHSSWLTTDREAGWGSADYLATSAGLAR